MIYTTCKKCGHPRAPTTIREVGDGEVMTVKCDKCGKTYSMEFVRTYRASPPGTFDVYDTDEE